MLILDRDIINKMDADELRNYLYKLQNYIKTERNINSIRKRNEDTLIHLLRQREILSTLIIEENDQMNQLTKLANEIGNKYASECLSHDWEDDTF